MDSPTEIRSQAGSPEAASAHSDAENEDPQSMSQVQFASQTPTELKDKPAVPQVKRPQGASTAADLLSLRLPPRKKQKLDALKHIGFESQREESNQVSRGHTIDSIQDFSQIQTQHARHTTPAPKQGHSAATSGAQDKSTTKLTCQVDAGLRRDTASYSESNLSAASDKQNNIPSPVSARPLTPKANVADHRPYTGDQGKGCIFDPFRDLRRNLVKGRFLPRHPFQVPTDQQTILEAKSVWQPPRVGQREPYGCMPPKVLEVLANAADREQGAVRGQLNTESEPPNHLYSPLRTLSPAQNSSKSRANAQQSVVRDETEPQMLSKPAPEHLEKEEFGVAPVFSQSLSDEDSDDQVADHVSWSVSPPRQAKRMLPPDSSDDGEGSLIGWRRSNQTAKFPDEIKQAHVHETGGSDGENAVENQVQLNTPKATHEDLTSMTQSPVTDKSGPCLNNNQQSTSSKAFRSESLEGTQESNSKDADQFQSKVQVRRTPLVRYKPDLPSAAAIAPRVGLSSKPRLNTEEHALSQVPGTFTIQSTRQSPSSTDQHKSIVPNAPLEESNTLNPTENELTDEDDLDEDDQSAVSQQLFTELAEDQDPAHNGIVPRVQQDVAERCDSYLDSSVVEKPPSSAQAAVCMETRNSPGRETCQEKPYLFGDRKHGEVNVKESSSNTKMRPTDASIQLTAQENRRQFMRRLRADSTGSKGTRMPEGVVRTSSRLSAMRGSSEILNAFNRTPNTSILPDTRVNLSAPVSGSKIESMYLSFCAAYPVYKGELKHFENICRMVQLLQREGRAPHSFMLDDFVIRHRDEYAAYSQQQLQDGEEIMPYIDFYNDRVTTAQHLQGVLNSSHFKASVVESKRVSVVVTPTRKQQSNSIAGRKRIVDSEIVTTPENHHKNRLDQSIAASESASNIVCPSSKRRKVASSSPLRQLPIEEAIENLHASQSSMVLSWLNKAPGEESPVLGESHKDVDRSDILSFAVGEEIQESEAGTPDSDDKREIPLPKRYPNFGSGSQKIPNVVQANEGEGNGEVEDEDDDDADDEDDDPEEWWHDRNTAFKEWARAHEFVSDRASIKRQRTNARGELLPVLSERINIMGWRK